MCHHSGYYVIHDVFGQYLFCKYTGNIFTTNMNSSCSNEKWRNIRSCIAVYRTFGFVILTVRWMWSVLINMQIIDAEKIKTNWGSSKLKSLWSSLQVSWTTALRQIVVNCYKYHGRDDLLPAFNEEEEKTQVQPLMLAVMPGSKSFLCFCFIMVIFTQVAVVELVVKVMKKKNCLSIYYKYEFNL